MTTAKEFLMNKATENNDGFLSGQPKWIIEAMEDYARAFHEKIIADAFEAGTLYEQYKGVYCNLYPDKETYVSQVCTNSLSEFNQWAADNGFTYQKAMGVWFHKEDYDFYTIKQLFDMYLGKEGDSTI